MLRRTRYGVGSLRVELPAPDDRDPARRSARQGRPRGARDRHFHRAFPDPATDPESTGAAGRRRAGAADRRARSHRRAVRGVSARSARRVSGDDPGARRDRGAVAADCRHHSQPHARDPRRDQAALPLSLGRLPERCARACDRPAQGARRRPPAVARGRRIHAALARDGFVQGAGNRRDAGLGGGSGRAGQDRAGSGDGREYSGRAPQISGRHRGGLARGRDAPRRRGAPRGRCRARIVKPLAARAADEARLAENILHFARVLRAAGLPVGPAKVIGGLEAVQAGGVERREDFRAALESVLIERHDSQALFDQAFDLYWRKPRLLERMMQLLLPKVYTRAPRADAEAPLSARIAEALAPPRVEEQEAEPQEVAVDAVFTFSPREVLQSKDFETMTAAELSEVRAMIARLRLPLPELPIRRTVAASRGSAVDLRATLRAMVSAGGTVVPLAWRGRRRAPPPPRALRVTSGSLGQQLPLLVFFLLGDTS